MYTLRMANPATSPGSPGTRWAACSYWLCGLWTHITLDQHSVPGTWVRYINIYDSMPQTIQGFKVCLLLPIAWIHNQVVFEMCSAVLWVTCGCVPLTDDALHLAVLSDQVFSQLLLTVKVFYVLPVGLVLPEQQRQQQQHDMAPAYKRAVNANTYLARPSFGGHFQTGNLWSWLTRWESFLWVTILRCTILPIYIQLI